MRDEILEEAEACRISPLQVIEKQHERMIFFGENVYELAKYDSKSILRFGRRELRNGRLRTDQVLDLRNHVHVSCPFALSACKRRDLQIVIFSSLWVRISSTRSRKAWISNEYGTSRSKMLELSGKEKRPLLLDPFAELLDKRGFSDAGEPGNQDQLGGLAFSDTLKSREELEPLLPLGHKDLADLESVGDVFFSERKGFDFACRGPLGARALEIQLKPPPRSDSDPRHFGQEL